MEDKSYELARLDTLPELVDETNQLIEKSFAYQESEQFAVDFFPLAGLHNLNHRHVLIEGGSRRVVAHIGVSQKSFCWGADVVPVAFLGGIAVAEDRRGQGLFHRLLVNVVSRYESQCAFFLLWSEKHDMYHKYGFHLAGRQWCYRMPGETPQGHVAIYEELPVATKLWMADLYRRKVNQSCFSPLRDAQDWSHIAEMRSATLRLTGARDKPTGYYFTGKGMDLGGIVHDWAHEEGVAGLIRESGSPGMIWAAHNVPVDDEVRQDLQQVGLWKPNTHGMALQKISLLLGGATVTWDFPHFHVRSDKGSWKLLPEELLDEVFSYGTHGIRSSGVPVWVGGLDSV
jgi:predicted N-acetyltransferase YhbS